jgi:hypothetical protein
VQFTAVINVHDGPGYGALPDPEYSHAITTLNGFNNVRTVGYVATTWCERDLSSALDDVAAYSFWGEYQDSLAIDGIFVDETPTQYSQAFDSYLQTIAQAVHASDGLKEGYIGRVTFSYRYWCCRGRTEARFPRSLQQFCMLLHRSYMPDPDLCSHNAWYWYPLHRQLQARRADIIPQSTIQARFLTHNSSETLPLRITTRSDRI